MHEHYHTIKNISQENHLSPHSLALELHRAFPPGGIAVHGGTQSKIESIQKKGLSANLSSYIRGIYFLSSANYNDTEKSTNTKRERTHEFLEAVRTAAEWGVARGIGNERCNTAEHSQNYSYQELSAAFDSNDTEIIQASDLPALVLFESTPEYQLNQLHIDPDLPKKSFHQTHETTTSLPAELVKDVVVLTFPELQQAWKNAEQKVALYMPLIDQVTSSSDARAVLKMQLPSLSISDGVRAALQEEIFSYGYTTDKNRFCENIHKALFFDEATNILTQETVKKLIQIYLTAQTYILE